MKTSLRNLKNSGLFGLTVPYSIIIIKKDMSKITDNKYYKIMPLKKVLIKPHLFDILYFL